MRGKQLVSNHKGKWAYRVGNYRVIVELDENILVILALDVAHRSTVYKQKR